MKYISLKKVQFAIGRLLLWFNFFWVFYFTGAELAHGYSFPDELISRGCYREWTVMECLTNLAQMSIMSDSPVKMTGRRVR